MKATESKTLVEFCESCLRAGQVARAEQALSRLNTARINRPWRLPLARLCRRSGLISTAMRILTPLFRNKNHQPDASESAEYGMLLLRAGAVREAKIVLSSTDPAKAPEALLFSAFAHFSTWEYEKAIPLLQAYLQSALGPYEVFVGHVNLAAALLGAGFNGEAERLLEDNVAYAEDNKHYRLKANCLEMLAQLHIRRGDLAVATQALEAAAQALGDNKANDQLFVRKWKAVVESRQAGSTEPLLRFRQEASERRDWESVRDADFQILRLRFDRNEFDHLYAGTPFSSYRANLMREFGTEPSSDEIVLGSGPRRLDLAQGVLDNQKLEGQSSHQIVEILLRDLYRPLNIGGLFSELHPGEFFDIFSSPDRVHQALRRARQWIESENLPLEIVHEGGTFQLILQPGLEVVLPIERRPMASKHLHLHQLKMHFGRVEWFSTQEALLEMGVSRASLKRLLSWATEQGLLKKFGQGRATKYFFAA